MTDGGGDGRGRRHPPSPSFAPPPLHGLSLLRPSRSIAPSPLAGEGWGGGVATGDDGCDERVGSAQTQRPPTSPPLPQLLHLAPLAGRGRNRIARCDPGEGDYPRVWCVESAPHPNPLRASFARLDPAKSGAREPTAVAVSFSRL